MATAESSDQGMIASDMRYLGAGNTVVDDDSDPRTLVSIVRVQGCCRYHGFSQALIGTATLPLGRAHTIQRKRPFKTDADARVRMAQKQIFAACRPASPV